MSDVGTTRATIESQIGHYFERYLSQGDIVAVLDIIGYTALVLVALEFFYDLIVRRRRSIREPVANGLIHVIWLLLMFFTVYGVIRVIAFIWLEQYALFDIPNTLWSWVLCIVLADFVYYWMHRVEHNVRLFWAVHSVHHSSEEYDLSTSLRIFWFADFWAIPFLAPLILLGFSGPQVAASIITVGSYMIWIHTEKIGKLGWFDRYFNSPSCHRVHHGTNEQYLDKNYGGILIIWDRLFGTYEPEDEKVKYGLTTPINTSNPFLVSFAEFFALGRDLWQRKGVDRVKTLILPPRWRPDQRAVNAGSRSASDV